MHTLLWIAFDVVFVFIFQMLKKNRNNNRCLACASIKITSNSHRFASSPQLSSSHALHTSGAQFSTPFRSNVTPTDMNRFETHSRFCTYTFLRSLLATPPPIEPHPHNEPVCVHSNRNRRRFSSSPTQENTVPQTHTNGKHLSLGAFS